MLGCSVTVERVGSPALLEEMRWEGEATRAPSIVDALGVPDAIEAEGDGFRLIYRLVRRNEKRFQIGSYGFKLVTDEQLHARDGSLELVFDANGRLVASRSSTRGAPEAEGSR